MRMAIRDSDPSAIALWKTVSPGLFPAIFQPPDFRSESQTGLSSPRELNCPLESATQQFRRPTSSTLRVQPG